MFGCDRGDSAAPAPTTAAAITAPPIRIVSLAPSVTETLFALGVGDRVVGVTRFCDFPVAATMLPKIGGLTDVDVEVVLSLKPDLVVGVTSKTGSSLERTLRAAQVDTLFLAVETFDDVQSSLRTLGARVGATERAETLAAAIGAIDVTPHAAAPSVLVLFGRDPWIAAGPKTFADEMIRRAGGRNVLADLDTPYPTLDVERLSAIAPDIIIDTSWGAGEPGPVPVAKASAIVRLNPALIRPGPRLAAAMMAFREAIVAAETP